MLSLDLTDALVDDWLLELVLSCVGARLSALRVTGTLITEVLDMSPFVRLIDRLLFFCLPISPQAGLTSIAHCPHLKRLHLARLPGLLHKVAPADAFAVALLFAPGP